MDTWRKCSQWSKLWYLGCWHIYSYCMALPIFFSGLTLSKKKADDTQKFVNYATSKFNPKEET